MYYTNYILHTQINIVVHKLMFTLQNHNITLQFKSVYTTVCLCTSITQTALKLVPLHAHALSLT